MSFGLQFLWNRDNPTFVKDYEYITLKSSFRPVIFGGIRKRRVSLFKPKYEYLVEMNFIDAETGRKYGGWFPTLEEAKAAANRYLRVAFYDARDYGPQQPDTIKE